MDETALEIKLLARTVTKILQAFQEWNSKGSRGKPRYSHVDVTLSNEGTVQITNYGQSTSSILSFSGDIFKDLVPAQELFKNSLIATIHSRNEHSDCQSTMSLRYARNRLLLTKNTNDKDLISFPHQKNYLSYQLKHKLVSRDTEEFAKLIINEIILLQRLNPHTKFTYHCGGKVLYNNHIPLDNDYKSCQVLATALTNIIRHSVNVEFKENCLSMLKVDNSHQAEAALMAKLLPLIHANYTLSDNN